MNDTRHSEALYFSLMQRCEENRLDIIKSLFANYHGYTSR